MWMLNTKRDVFFGLCPLRLPTLCSCVQEESEPQRQQEEGQPEGPETSWPLDPPRRNGNEKHGKGPERRPLWPRLAHPVLPGPAAGCPQPIREPDRQQEQPLRYSHDPISTSQLNVSISLPGGSSFSDIMSSDSQEPKYFVPVGGNYTLLLFSPSV